MVSSGIIILSRNKISLMTSLDVAPRILANKASCLLMPTFSPSDEWIQQIYPINDI